MAGQLTPLLGLLSSECNPREKSEGKGGVRQESRVKKYEHAAGHHLDLRMTEFSIL